MAKDPVCAMEIDERQSAGTSVYNGRTFYFCSERCREAFDRNPKAYTARADMQLHPEG
jgi:YHS domain-containing protein